MVFDSSVAVGRIFKDFLPIKPGSFSPSEVWVDCREKRELAVKSRFLRLIKVPHLKMSGLEI